MNILWPLLGDEAQPFGTGRQLSSEYQSQLATTLLGEGGGGQDQHFSQHGMGTRFYTIY